MSDAISASRKPHPLLLAGVMATAVASVVGAHAYILQRLVFDVDFPGWVDGAAIALAVVGFAGAVSLPAFEQKLRPPLLRRVAWPFAIWMGVFWIGFNVVWLTDLMFWTMGASGGSVGGVRAAFATTAIVAACVAGVRGSLRIPAVKRVEVPLERWPEALDGFRIAQISDIHIGPILDRRYAQGLTDAVNALDADLVAVTGDLVDGSVELLRDDVEPFAELRGRHGVFFVTGNHDAYSGGESWVDRVRELGMRVLRNERVAIGEGDASFDLAGVDDHRGDWRHGSTSDLGAALAGRDDTRAVVLLAHDPATFRKAKDRGVDLQLSGHTHGGQIWPFYWLVRLSVRWVAGLYREGPAQIYVSRGSGFWGPPMRLFAPSEITELTLRAAPASRPN